MTEWGEPIAGKGSAHDWTSEDTLVATYHRTDEIDVPDDSKPGGVRSSKMHRFLRDGEFVDVWGAADLDGKIRELKPGQLVRIVYLGMEDIGNGRSMKRFTVQVAKGRPAAVAADEDDIPF